MAFLQTTVTGFDNIYNEILTFLKTSPDLVSHNSQWVKVGDYSGYYGTGEYLKGVGNGLRNVYVLISKNHHSSNHAYNLLMMTFTGFTASMANEPFNQPGASLQYVTVTTNDTDPCEIVLAANGRRFTGYLHTLNKWNNFYVGMFIPYSEPAHYTFPVALIGQSKFADEYLNFTSSSDSRKGFLNSSWSTITGDPYVSGGGTTALIYQPDGQQLRVVGTNMSISFGAFDPILRRGNQEQGDRPLDYRGVSPGGVEHLLPVKIQRINYAQGFNTGQMFGELDGIRCPSGVGQQTGKVITDEEGVEWIVSQSGHLSGPLYHHAVRMS